MEKSESSGCENWTVEQRAEGGVGLRKRCVGSLPLCLLLLLLPMMSGGCAKSEIEEGRDSMAGIKVEVSSENQEEAVEPVVFEGKDMEGMWFRPIFLVRRKSLW